MWSSLHFRKLVFIASKEAETCQHCYKNTQKNINAFIYPSQSSEVGSMIISFSQMRLGHRGVVICPRSLSGRSGLESLLVTRLMPPFRCH